MFSSGILFIVVVIIIIIITIIVVNALSQKRGRVENAESIVPNKQPLHSNCVSASVWVWSVESVFSWAPFSIL